MQLWIITFGKKKNFSIKTFGLLKFTMWLFINLKLFKNTKQFCHYLKVPIIGFFIQIEWPYSVLKSKNNNYMDFLISAGSQWRLWRHND